jgi:hypothetical protein
MKISVLGLIAPPPKKFYCSAHAIGTTCDNVGWPSFQIAPDSDFPNLPDHQDNKSTTPLGITQAIPNKANFNDQSSCAIVQCRSRWLTNSPLALHMQHQSIMITLHFLRLSTVRILSKAAVQVKKATLVGTFDFHTLFQGKKDRGGCNKQE